MQIDLKHITIRDLAADYKDSQEEGVVGFGGKLNIRPPYQREFVYKDKQREAVIDTVVKGYPLNIMYWAVTPDGFEIIDGQQRAISICQFINQDFSFKDRYFRNLQQDEREAILNYQLTIYQCHGSDSEKLAWFRTINIAGEKLMEQELRNAVYAGPWLTDAKRYFSKNQCPAYQLGGVYMSGSAIRQDYLEAVISWVGQGGVEDYMAKHQHDKNAAPLWQYFNAVVTWVKTTFPNYRAEMKGIPWGDLYNAHKDSSLDDADLEKRISALMEDEDVTNKKGIYTYVLDGDERALNIRVFSKNQKREAYERQKGICVVCRKHYELEEMEADHIKPWSKGGATDAANCQLLCKMDNRRKSAK